MLSNIPEEEFILLETRTGYDDLIAGQEKKYISKYESIQRFCMDPYGDHKKHIIKNLTPIDHEIVFFLKLKPGQKLCKNCYKKVKHLFTVVILVRQRVSWETMTTLLTKV